MFQSVSVKLNYENVKQDACHRMSVNKLCTFNLQQLLEIRTLQTETEQLVDILNRSQNRKLHMSWKDDS